MIEVKNLWVILLLSFATISIAKSEELSEKELWKKFNANVELLYANTDVLDPHIRMDPVKYKLFFTGIDQALDGLIEKGTLEEVTFELDLHALQGDEYNKIVKKPFENLIKEYGEYSAIEMSGFGSEFYIKTFAPGEMCLVTSRVPAKKAEELRKILKEMKIEELSEELLWRTMSVNLQKLNKLKKESFREQKLKKEAANLDEYTMVFEFDDQKHGRMAKEIERCIQGLVKIGVLEEVEFIVRVNGGSEEALLPVYEPCNDLMEELSMEYGSFRTMEMIGLGWGLRSKKILRQYFTIKKPKNSMNFMVKARLPKKYAQEFKSLLEKNVSFAREEVTTKSEGHTLAGELIHSEGVDRTAVLILAGSGATDRDGNTVGAHGGNNSLKYLADFLKSENVASLRVDKRGVAKSAKDVFKEQDLRLSTYVADVKQWVKFLNDSGYGKVVIVGHSEGAHIAALAASTESVAGLVTLAGIGRPFADVLREQLEKNLPAEQYAIADKIITKLEKGERVKDVPKDQTMQALFRQSVQPYLISSMKHNPAKDIATVKVPVLVVQGSTDLQVSIEDAKILDTAAKESELLVIEGMNHVLKDVEGDLAAQYSSYFNPRLRINSTLEKEVLRFVRKIDTKK